MKTKIIQFLREEDGVTTLEYGVLAAVVAVVIGTVFYSKFGSTLTTLLGLVDTNVTNAANAGASGAG